MQIKLFFSLLVFFKNNFHNKAKKVCIKTRSPSPSLPSITVKWPVGEKRIILTGTGEAYLVVKLPRLGEDKNEP